MERLGKVQHPERLDRAFWRLLVGIVAVVDPRFRPSILPEQGGGSGPPPPVLCGDCSTSGLVPPPVGGALLCDLRAGVSQYQDAAGTNPCLADGDPCRLWKDQTANGNDFTAFGAANPLFQTKQQGALPMTLLSALDATLKNASLA